MRTISGIHDEQVASQHSDDTTIVALQVVFVIAAFMTIALLAALSNYLLL